MQQDSGTWNKRQKSGDRSTRVTVTVYLSSKTLSARLLYKQWSCPEVLISIHPTAAHVSHDQVPAQGDSILVGPCGVVLGQAGLEEPLGVVVSL